MHYISDNNSDEDLQKGGELEFIPGTLYGKEHPWFWRIHITALVSLGECRNTRYAWKAVWLRFLVFLILSNLCLVYGTVQ